MRRVARFIVLLLVVAGPARARAPLPTSAVEAALGELDDGPRGLTQLLSLLDHLDVLTPANALSALEKRAAGPSLHAARARLELAVLRDSPAPPGILTAALAVAVLAPDSVGSARMAQLHLGLADAHVATRAATFDGDDPDRRWTPVGEGPTGAIALEALVPGNGQVVLHVVIPFALDAPTSGMLRLGASGDLAVSIAGADPSQGRFIGVARALERAVPDQLEAPISLAAGQHLLLVTFKPNAGEPALLRVRIDTPVSPTQSLSPLHWSRVAVPSALPELAWNSDVRQLGATHSIEGLVLARLMGLPDLTSKVPKGRVAPLLEERLARAPLSSRDFLLALAAVRRTEDRASLLLERIDARCASCARDPLLTLALAAHTAERGQLTQARALVDEVAARADPELVTYLRVHLARLANAPEEALIAFAVTRGGPAELVQRLVDIPVRARLEVAQAALDVGRSDVALAIFTDLSAAFPGRIDLALNRMRAAQAAGDIALATAIAQRAAERRQDRPALALDAAQKLIARAGEGDRAVAVALVANATTRLHWKSDALVDAGRLLESLDDRAAAVSAYARALEVNPANDNARRDLERLQGAEPVPLTLDLAQTIAMPVVDRDATFEVLGEELFVKVRSDGSATRWIRRILRAQAVPAARDARTLTIRFDPTQESVRVIAATIRRAAGGAVTTKTPAEPVPDRHLQSIAEDWYGLYYDLRQLAVPFDHLERGDVIEVTWRVDPVGQLFPGVVDLFEVLLDRVPKHLHRITIETPAGLSLRTRLNIPDGMDLAPVEHVSPLADGGTRRSVEIRGLPGLPAEALAPGTAEVSPVWQATTFKTWRDVATWYRQLVEPQKVLTPAMKAFVAEARANNASADTVLARLADYVTREIRYVGLEFGIHGYKPYRTDQVWSRRFGDCKDKATLLSALMAEAGLDGDVTLVRTRKQGRLAGALPSLSLFDHAVLYVRSRAALVDPTATYFGLGELPRDDQGAQILVLAPPDDPADLQLSQVDLPSRNGITGTYSVTLEQRGGAGIQGVVRFLGTQAPVYRSLLLDGASQKVRLAELMNRRYPGLALSDYRISDPRDKTRPLELSFRAEVPRFGQLQSEADGTLYVTRPTGIDGHLERFASEERRQLPMVLGPPMRWDLTYRYVLPDGHHARELPRGGEVNGPYGSYRVTWIDEGQIVTVRAELTYAVDQVAAKDYMGLRDFVRGFEVLAAMPLVLARGGAGQ